VVFLVFPVAGTDNYKIRLLRKREVPRFEPLFPRDGLTLPRSSLTRSMLHYLCTWALA
jgi:hypothetical protein